MMKSLLSSAILSGLFCLTACSTGGTPINTEKPFDPNWLQSREWVVEDINKGGVIDRYHATLKFDGSNVTGSTGCNRFTGSFEFSGNTVTLSPLATTRRACAPAVMDLEQKFLNALSGPVSVSKDDTGALILTSASGSILAR